MDTFLSVFLLLTLTAPLPTQSFHNNHLHNNNNDSDIFDVVDHGAIGDGHTDDTQAFKDAWEATCMSSSSSPTMHIPTGKTFLLNPLTFGGECKSKSINFVIDGDIIAPSEPPSWRCHNNICGAWIVFYEVDGLNISGSGTIDGQGSNWWDYSCKNVLDIAHCNNVHLSKLSFKDSPQMHIRLQTSTWVYISNITITAPGDSPNTDGIHIRKCTNVFIDDSVIGTGDDCISIGNESSNLTISRIVCGPGHGISIGSLGQAGDDGQVEYVHVSDVQFKGTTNGARIKTWQGGKGYVRHIVFERIMCTDAAQPIIIDQFYCDHTRCTNHTSAVQVSNVTYSNIYGTSSYTKPAVKLACSESVPCTDIFMNNVTLRSNRDGRKATTYCLDAYGRVQGEIVPPVPCLTHR
ncbi:hypothetical protein HHK36_024789 [Tetracentron sinense]|uniref:Polygalacturonase n=1 Tax=Tetracentron sinense TaxID=13715 RepID=A0A834YJZ3_TETSI|nr:hypothetical protein HHK36_024789 [Tetracentron sinense]